MTANKFSGVYMYIRLLVLKLDMDMHGYEMHDVLSRV